jgi:hypothetical protein
MPCPTTGSWTVIRKALCTVLLTIAASGCYAYAPIPVNTVEPSMTVRVETRIGERVERVEGEVFEVADGTLSVLPEVRPGEDDGPRVYRFSEVSEITRRSLHTGWTLAVLGAGAAAGVGALLLAGGEPAGTGGPGGGPDFDLIPILRAIFSP